MTKAENGVEISSPKEIERKFRVTAIPFDLKEFPVQEINQGYLHIDADGSESRLRAIGDNYYFTHKSGGGMIRTERQIALDKSQFLALWPATEGKRIEKTRYAIPHEGLTIELDLYEGDLDGLVTAEVEFPDTASARAFNPPEWLGDDITADKAFKNQRLALDGAPRSSRLPGYIGGVATEQSTDEVL